LFLLDRSEAKLSLLGPLLGGDVVTSVDAMVDDVTADREPRRALITLTNAKAMKE
jgi:hypothetical protein